MLESVCSYFVIYRFFGNLHAINVRKCMQVFRNFQVFGNFHAINVRKCMQLLRNFQVFLETSMP